MPIQKAEQRTLKYFRSGFHCAEALSKAIVEIFSDRPAVDIPGVASGFGGGTGRSRQEMCGALAGGVIALGFLCGRMEPDKDVNRTQKLVEEFRRRFIENFGSSNCGVLLETLGEQEKMSKCIQLTARAAGVLADLLVENGFDYECESCGLELASSACEPG